MQRTSGELKMPEHESQTAPATVVAIAQQCIIS